MNRLALVVLGSLPLLIGCNVEPETPRAGRVASALQSWTRCAAEGVPAPGNVCKVPGTRVVRYGIPGAYRTKVVTGSVVCEDASFGAGPTQYQNFCDFGDADATPLTPAPTPAPTPTTPPPPATTVTWTRCAAEGVGAPGDVCTFAGTREVRYGIPGAYTVKVASGSIECSDGAFGVTVATPYQNFCDYSSVDATTPSTPPPSSPPPGSVTPPAPSTGGVGPRVASFVSSGPITASAGQTISGVRISNPNGPCITINAANVTVRDSDIGPCGGSANIVISNGGTGAIVDHASIHNGRRGVLVNGATNVTTTKNAFTTFTGPPGQGYGSAIEYDYASGGLVDGNEVRGQSYVSDAVSFFESSNVRLTNNLIDVGIDEPSSAGFTMGDMVPGSGHSPGANNYVAGNVVRQTGGVPAGVFGSAGNTILERNCLTAGIQAYNYSGVFVGVTVRQNVIDMGASFVPDSSVIAGWSTNIDSTDCSLVPK